MTNKLIIKEETATLFLETNSTTVICPKCNQSPVIKYTPNRERTLITCPCGYVHEIEINF